MKRSLFCFLLILMGLVGFKVVFASGQKTNGPECSKYSDTFDIYNPMRWQEVLFYSETRGMITVEEGQLVLEAQKGEPIEIQVYSLFVLDGDFDIQADYDVSDNENLESCRFNAGIVLQTLGDEKSYKCYVSSSPENEVFFRSRLDEFGEKNIEKHKGDPAPKVGKIRVVRKDHIIEFLAFRDNEWRYVYRFSKVCEDKLRMRFKLQTGGDEEAKQMCPAVVKFDNFVVNSCHRITGD